MCAAVADLGTHKRQLWLISPAHTYTGAELNLTVVVLSGGAVVCLAQMISPFGDDLVNTPADFGTTCFLSFSWRIISESADDERFLFSRGHLYKLLLSLSLVGCNIVERGVSYMYKTVDSPYG